MTNPSLRLPPGDLTGMTFGVEPGAGVHEARPSWRAASKGPSAMSASVGEENAEIIVRAVNAHSDLVEACRSLRFLLKAFVGPDDAIANAVFEAADKALELAGVELTGDITRGRHD